MRAYMKLYLTTLLVNVILRTCVSEHQVVLDRIASDHSLPCCTGDCGTDLCTNGTCVRRIASGQACIEGEPKPRVFIELVFSKTTKCCSLFHDVR